MYQWVIADEQSKLIFPRRENFICFQ